MKIAYVITRADSVGGASIHVRDLGRAMRERGHETVVLAGGDGPLRDQLSGAGVPFRSLRYLRRELNPAADVRAARELGSVLRELAPDLVSTHTAKAGLLGRYAGSRLGVPVLYTPHGWSIGDRISPALGAFLRPWERLASGWGKAIICVSEYERRLALAYRIAPDSMLYVVRNGIRDVPAELRAAPATQPVRIVSVARLASPKDHETLLHALAALSSRPWDLDLIGDGPRQSGISELARRLGIADRVHLLGYQARPELTLARAQIFVLSSRSESFPRSVLEAMRTGLPVIATDVGGVHEQFADGVHGLLVPRGQPEAMAAALAALLDDPRYRKRLGVAGRREFELRFRLEPMVEATAAIYDTVLCPAKPRRSIA